MKWISVGVIAGLWIAGAQPSSSPSPSVGGPNSYSPDQETKLGREAAAGLEEKLTIVHEPTLDSYSAKIGSELGNHLPYWSPFSPASYRFTLYEDRKPLEVASVAMAMPNDALRGPAREPIALAGGPIFVPLSLLAGSENESVYAFHLAHAMAHVALRHSTSYASRLESMRNRGENRIPGSSDSNSKFLRQCELEADSAAADMILKAGYDAGPVTRYLETLPAAGFGLARIAGSERAEVVRREIRKSIAQVRGADKSLFEQARASAIPVR